ncbi:YigZ family protein [Candidatus Poribacteria bacterium]|nr:YigZ family protein [Candidatus Poribacteria bacterium]
MTEKDKKYRTIRDISVAEHRIKKSRFIGLATCVTTENEGINFINKIREKYPNATHYCYALSIIGSGPHKLIRSSDDGEPLNSAGKPILTAIESLELDNVICVVVRYFGGIKLGIGGLIRAYGQTARDCLENADTVIYIPTDRLQIEMSYDQIGKVINLVKRMQGKILGMEQDSIARAEVLVRSSVIPQLEDGIKALNGDIVIKQIK